MLVLVQREKERERESNCLCYLLRIEKKGYDEEGGRGGVSVPSSVQ